MLLHSSIFLLCPIAGAFGTPISHDSQQVILGSDHDSASNSKFYSLPVRSFSGVLHTANITIGTPPQHFNATLDINNDAYFVPSITCDDACRFWADKHLYDPDQSSTYKHNGTRVSEDYSRSRYRGKLVRDTIRFEDLEVSDQTFMAYDDRLGIGYVGWDFGFDGVLGLAPPWKEESEHRFPNFLKQIDETGALNETVFSLKLPRGLEDEGEFTLGGANPDLYTGAFHTVKVLNDSEVNVRFTGLWNLPIESVTLNTSIPYHVPLLNYTAVLTSDPIIVLPTTFARDFYKVIGVEQFNLIWGAVPCDRRAYLPELTFTIGGHNLTITAFDYTFEFEMPYGFAPACLVWLGRQDEWGDDIDAVVLGSTFLKGFYSKFDWEKKEIGC